MTLVPAQIVLPGVATIPADGAAFAVTAIVIPLDVAVAGLGQDAVLVSTTVTTSPFNNDAF